MRAYKFSVVVEKDSDGYFAFCPELQDCYTQGDSYEEVLENIKDAIRLHVERGGRVCLDRQKRFISDKLSVHAATHF